MSLVSEMESEWVSILAENHGKITYQLGRQLGLFKHSGIWQAITQVGHRNFVQTLVAFVQSIYSLLFSGS